MLKQTIRHEPSQQKDKPYKCEYCKWSCKCDHENLGYQSIEKAFYMSSPLVVS